jgi:branched-chain amino acid transport system permease protein
VYLQEEESNALKAKYIISIPLGIFAIGCPFIITSIYLRQLLILFLIFSILALSLDIILGYMGQFSFGHQVALGFGAYTVGFLSVMWRISPSPWLSFFASIGVGAAFGLIIGLVALRATRGVYLAIITFGVAKILRTYFYVLPEVTGGSRGISLIPSLAVPPLKFDTQISFYYLALGCLILTVYLITRWLCSPFGRAVVAIRENEDLAKSTGINSYKYYVMAFTLSTALAGFSGSLYAFYMKSITPALFNIDYMLMMLIMVIVGGSGTIGGPILGAAIYVFGLNLIPIGKELALVVFGGILLACIIFLPRGIYPYLKELFFQQAE